MGGAGGAGGAGGISSTGGAGGGVLDAHGYCAVDLAAPGCVATWSALEQSKDTLCTACASLPPGTLTTSVRRS